MAKSRFTQHQIMAIVREMEQVRPLKALARKHGVSTATLHRWKLQVASDQGPTRERLRSLEVEHRRLKSKFAELSLDYLSLRAALLEDVKKEC
ncbi:MAG: hypothetical protein E6R14_02265 [Thermomicrobiales bacterium]|nr:MAG: hypothetical protein E6R14_02265 [Thermomicrobiales bacterium]